MHHFCSVIRNPDAPQKSMAEYLCNEHWYTESLFLKKSNLEIVVCFASAHLLMPICAKIIPCVKNVRVYVVRYVCIYLYWCLGDNQSVRSSVPVVSRWLWPGNRTFLEVASMVATWWLVAFLRSIDSDVNIPLKVPVTTIDALRHFETG